MTTLKQRLVAQIAQDGPLTVAQYMTAALHDPEAGYYARHAALGADGDFVTAPEISQMFGELVGLWCVDAWAGMGAPSPVALVELGPGGGRMMTDMARVMKVAPAFQQAAHITLVETSPVLRQRQAEALSGLPVSWAAHIGDVPPGPALIVGNEFLDCMPIRQAVRTQTGWRERLVGVRGDDLVFGLSGAAADPSLVPPERADAPVGAVLETAPSLPGFVALLAARFRDHPGRALFVDYGGDGRGDTLQALARHAKVDPLAGPGGADLTAHVDFVTLAELARNAGLDVTGPVGQGAWLGALGIDVRAARLAAARPESAATIERQRRRLVDADAMGVLFQAICLSSPGLPPPAGFA